MKIQDILFFVILLLVLLKRNPKITAIGGIICFVLSIPLFSAWIFFTAERLVWYGAAFFLVSAILLFFGYPKNE